ncbi:MAG: hypothetical protein ACLFPU_09520 [Dehalococcoidia bacterium]
MGQQNKFMILMLISTNPLFVEVILDLVARCEISEVIFTTPGDSLELIHRSKPNVVILDNSIEASLIEKLLGTVRSMENMRMILVNSGDNNYVIVNSQRSTIGKIEDLIQVIQEGRRATG